MSSSTEPTAFERLRSEKNRLIQSEYNKRTIGSDIQSLVVSMSVRRHRLIPIDYIAALRCHRRGREFESRRPRHSFQALADADTSSGKLSAHSDQRKFSAARYLKHVKIAVAVSGVERFNGHRDHEIALSGVTDTLHLRGSSLPLNGYGQNGGAGCRGCYDGHRCEGTCNAMNLFPFAFLIERNRTQDGCQDHARTVNPASALCSRMCPRVSVPGILGAWIAQ
jgi:hypothetical protein